MQISQVNGMALKTKIMMMKINECCGIELTLKRPNHTNTMHDRVMKATTVSLNMSIATAIKERHVRWTAHFNLLKWFQRFWAFLIKYDFCREGRDGELFIDDATKHRIINIAEKELVLNRSKTRAGGGGAGWKCPFLIRTFRWQRGQWQNWRTNAREFLGAAWRESAPRFTPTCESGDDGQGGCKRTHKYHPHLEITYYFSIIFVIHRCQCLIIEMYRRLL